MSEEGIEVNGGSAGEQRMKGDDGWHEVSPAEDEGEVGRWVVGGEGSAEAIRR